MDSNVCRSNYFSVVDEELFMNEMDNLGGIHIEYHVIGIGDAAYRSFALFMENEEDWPATIEDDETGVSWDINFFQIVAAHLREDEVAVFIQAGHEKLRSVWGYAWAINSRFETREVFLADIYKLAKELGPNVTYSEY